MKRKSFEQTKFSTKSVKTAFSGLSSGHPSYIVSLVFALIFVLGGVVLSIFAPTELSNLTNVISNAVTKSSLTGQPVSIPMDEIAHYAIVLVCFYVAGGLCAFVSNFILNSISNYYARDLRSSIQKKINALPLSYFDTNQFGDILSRITNDVDNIAQNLTTSVASMFQGILMLLGVLIMMFVKSWQLALTCIASLPILLILVLLMGKLAMPQFRARQKVLGELNGVIEENYSGQVVIKAFGREDKERAQFDDPNKRLGKTMFLGEVYMGMLQPAMNFVSYLAYAGVMLVGGLLLVEGNSGVQHGTLVEFLVYVNLFQSPLSSISQSMNSLSSASAASGRVYEFLAEKEVKKEDGVPLRLLQNGPDSVRGQVEFQHVCFSYDPSREIIHDFSAKIAPGSKVAIVGPTGAGKTTMVNLLMRFYETSSGSILIDGVDTKEMSRSEIHDIFGMVLQDTWVFQGTLRENLVYNTKGVTEEQIQAALKATHLLHYVKTLPGGLDYEIKDDASLSSGERQLLTITRAMLRGCPLLILDEATSNVDTRTEERIQKAMDALTKGKTSFVIAHRLSTIKNADLILVMKDGNIIEQGNHGQLMEKNGFYASLYNSQFAFE